MKKGVQRRKGAFLRESIRRKKINVNIWKNCKKKVFLARIGILENDIKNSAKTREKMCTDTALCSLCEDLQRNKIRAEPDPLCGKPWKVCGRQCGWPFRHPFS